MEAEKLTKTHEQARVPLAELTRRWSVAKDAEETAAKEAERLRAELLERGVEIGYEDDSLVVGERSITEGYVSVGTLESKKIEKVLRDEGALKSAQVLVLSYEKTKALAKINEAVAKVFGALKSKAPVFRRASKTAK